MDNHTVTGCVYLFLAKKKKKPSDPTETYFVYMFYFYNLFFFWVKKQRVEGGDQCDFPI